VNVAWDAVAGAAGYLVQTRRTGTPWQAAVVMGGDTAAVAATGGPAQVVQVRVAAMAAGGGQGPWSEEAAFVSATRDEDYGRLYGAWEQASRAATDAGATVAALTAELAALRAAAGGGTELAAARRERDEAVAAVAASSDELTRLRAELAATEAQLHDAAAKAELAMSAVAEAQESARTAMAAATAASAAVRGAPAELERQIATLKAVNAGLEADKGRLAAENASLTARAEGAAHAAVTAEAATDRLLRKLRLLEDEVDASERLGRRGGAAGSPAAGAAAPAGVPAARTATNLAEATPAPRATPPMMAPAPAAAAPLYRTASMEVPAEYSGGGSGRVAAGGGIPPAAAAAPLPHAGLPAYLHGVHTHPAPVPAAATTSPARVPSAHTSSTVPVAAPVVLVPDTVPPERRATYLQLLEVGIAADAALHAILTAPSPEAAFDMALGVSSNQ